jgi:membrane protease YdiL (CAAX protease family)
VATALPPEQPFELPSRRLVYSVVVGSFCLVLMLFIGGQLLLFLNLPLGLMATSLLIFGAAGLFFPSALGQHALAFTGFRPTRWTLVLLAVGVSALNLPFANFLMAGAHELLPARWAGAADDTTRLLTDADGPARILIALAAGVAAPIGEELFFRGWLQTMLSQRMKQVSSVIVVAVIFSATHFDPVGFVARVELGMLFGFARIWSGSLLPGIAMHATHNLLSTAALYLLSDSQLTGTDEQFDWRGASAFAGIALILTIGLLVVFRRSAVASRGRSAPPSPALFHFTPEPASRIFAAAAAMLVVVTVVLYSLRDRLPGAGLSRPSPSPQLTPANATNASEVQQRAGHLK